MERERRRTGRGASFDNLRMRDKVRMRGPSSATFLDVAGIVESSSAAFDLESVEGAEGLVDEAVEVGLVADDLVEVGVLRDGALGALPAELFGVQLGPGGVFGDDAEIFLHAKDEPGGGVIRGPIEVVDGAGGDGGDIAVEALELPEGEGDAMGELAFEVAVRLEACDDAFEVGVPVAPAFAGNDGVGGEDAMFGVVARGDFLSPLGLGAAFFGRFSVVLASFWACFSSFSKSTF